MKKILLSFVIALTAMSVRAQEIDSLKSNQVNVDTLTAKINQLQHDYDLLVCKFDLNQLYQKIESQGHSLNINSNGILINCYNTRFDREVYAAYNKNYHSNVELYETIKKNADVLTTQVLLKIVNSNFTESELEDLKNSIKLIEVGLNKVQSALEYYEVVLNMYRNL